MSDKPEKMDKALHLKLVEAWWDGELEFYHIGAWKGATFPPLEGDRPQDYRIRPKPRLRPWKPEEVPVGAQVRFTGNLNSMRMLILTNLGDSLLGADRRWTASDLFGEMEHSLDGGKTWKPCGVEESQ